MGILVRAEIQPLIKQPPNQKLPRKKEVIKDEWNYSSARKAGSWKSGSAEVMDHIPQLTVKWTLKRRSNQRTSRS